MADFQRAYALTMSNEGGYANHPADRGGQTYRGIARRFNPDWPGWPTVDAAVREEKTTEAIDNRLSADAALQNKVEALYKRSYWDVNLLDGLTSQPLAEKLFDIGVNMGIGTAARMIREALNLTNSNGRAYADINPAGLLDRTLLALLNRHPRPTLLVQVLSALQAERYLNIMRSQPGQEVLPQAGSVVYNPIHPGHL